MDEPTADMLKLFVTGRDAACPGCGYNVRDLQTDRCPECGQQLELSLRLSELKQGLLIAGLVALSAGAGLNGLLLVFAMLTMHNFNWSNAEDRGFLGINGLGFLINAAVLAAWLKQWRRVRRLSFAVRFGLVAVFCMMQIIDIGVFAAKVR